MGRNPFRSELKDTSVLLMWLLENRNQSCPNDMLYIWGWVDVDIF